MELLERFTQFFAAVNGGASPYPWQCALFRDLAESGRWPAEITAPTGSGKSAVIDVHVFLVAERARQSAGVRGVRLARPPRRLVLVAPRRVLVDDQFERASEIAKALAEPRDEIVREVAEALGGLWSADRESTDASPLGVTRLRGGLALDLSWRLDPSRCQVICSTPQMWGSRLLFRGYRGSRLARNLETGLLAHDAVVVIDEAHLHSRLLSTARKVADIKQSEMSLQVVAMSATIGSPTLSEADLADPALRRRVGASKQITEIELEAWDDASVCDAIVSRAQELSGLGTVGVFVNTVKRAVSVARQLRALSDAAVVVICGRLRPADVGRIRQEHPGLLGSAGNADVAFLVSTQSLEVGVDLDLGAMVSEIAPAPALAQRAGRLNRSGSRNEASFSIVLPSEPAQIHERFFAPYNGRQVVEGMGWLRSLGGEISPQSVTDSELPIPEARPMPEISQPDLATLTMTSLPLGAEPDVALYLEEPRQEDDRTVSICARSHLEHGVASHRAVLAAPPRAHELASLSVGSELDAVLNAVSIALAIRGAGEEARVESLRSGTEQHDPRPGDIIVIPAGSKICTDRVIARPGRVSTAIDDVSSEAGDDEQESWTLPLELEHVAEALSEDPLLGTRAARSALARVLMERGEDDPGKLLRQTLRSAEVGWFADPENLDTGLLVVRRRRGAGELPPTGPDELVTLAAHGKQAEERVGQVVEKLDASEFEFPAEELKFAALHHDSGKVHPRFQRRMGAVEGDPPLAKPRPGHVPDRGDGWRHEQLSLGFAAASSDGDRLVTALVGAHHGHGRPLFTRDVSGLLDGWGEAGSDVELHLERLFGAAGEYERERAELENELGFHGLAFLEALLRCADMQVSREGS